MTTNNCTDCSLANLLDPASYSLAYALPLLLISIVLTFAGTFLILDRTRVFVPRRDAIQHLARNVSGTKRIENSIRWISTLEGGAGGLASGYVFGVYLVTFLSLLIPSVTTSAALAVKSFLAIWLSSALCCTFLSGRWKYAALGCTGIAGYATLGVACCVMLHPSLLARIAMVSILTIIGLVVCLLPLHRYQHILLRIGTSSSGAFGIILSIALLADIPVWREVWERLWVADAAGWGTSVEKGLSTAYCLFLLCGSAVDWLLHRKLGENPDQKWDAYLADYATALPNEASRAGTFKPLTTFWSRHFGRHYTDTLTADIVFSPDTDLKRPIPLPYRLRKHQPATTAETQLHREPTFLQKHRKRGVRGFKRTREAVRFRPSNVDDLSSSGEDDSDMDDLKPPVSSWVVDRSPSLSTHSSITLAAAEKVFKSADQDPKEEEFKTPNAAADTFDYSDIEEDVNSLSSNRTRNRVRQDRAPGLERRYGKSGPEVASNPSIISTSQRTAVGQCASTRPLVPLTSVPATPSLIRAIERVSAAQQAAYSPLPSSPAAVASVDGVDEHSMGPKWTTFWQEVKVKAGHEFAHHPQQPGA